MVKFSSYIKKIAKEATSLDLIYLALAVSIHQYHGPALRQGQMKEIPPSSS